MEGTPLLSPSDVTVIRRYVHTKFAPLPGDRRAEIVADAVRRALNQRLPALPDAWKRKMADELITRCLVGEPRDVKPDDVLDVFADWGADERERDVRLSEAVLEWMNGHSPGRWSMEQLSTRLERRRNYASSPSAPTNADERGGIAPVQRPARWSIRLPWPKRIPGIAWGSLAILVLGLSAIALLPEDRPQTPRETSLSSPATIPIPAPAPLEKPDIGLPDKLRYEEIDHLALKAYLRGRDAMLAEEPYFAAIVESARTHDIHPLLLFAIAGQEQGFVPRTAKNAKKIANNPFNVFHSWEEYNTDIRDSANIAAKLLARLGKERPEGREPFEWFNETYAEDPKWSEGVRRLFKQLSGLSAADIKKG